MGSLQGDGLSDSDRLRAENETLRMRLSKLTEAILRISEDLDLDTVLQEVVDNARTLTGARYSAITTLDEAGGLQDLIISGLSPEQKQILMNFPQGTALFNFLSAIQGPFRTGDFIAFSNAAGFPGIHPPIGAFLAMRIRDRDRHLGSIFLAEKESGGEFTGEDEEVLAMFAAQAAMAINNARQYGDERRANADLEALVNTSPVGVVVFDALTRAVIKDNREARRIVGGAGQPDRPFEELIDKVTCRRVDGREIAWDELPLERAIRTAETVRADEIVFHLEDGEEVTTLVNATPIFSEDDEIISVVVTYQDITPLEELERLRAEFLGMVSHELRAPLTSIKGSAATVLGTTSPLDPAETRQFFRIIEEQADHMRDLINNLLDLTRIETGTLSIVPEAGELPTIVDQARNAFLSGGYRNSIEVDLMPDLPPVWLDRQRAIQVLYNLFANASRYSREWSTIRVSVSVEGLYVVVSVADEGRGIPAERLPHLFSKFSSAETGNGDQNERGYGLGLAICKGIVEAHGGRIWAESAGQGHGTRLAFTIPAVDAAGARLAPHTAPVSQRLEAGEPEPNRILVIDDDPQILRYVRHTLSEAGYTPFITSNPEELQPLLESEKPDLVLLNLVLPGTNGFDLMERIPEINEVPVIFMSGRGGGQDIARAFEMGAADYVVKPFSPTELVARIRAALRKRAVLRMPEPYSQGDLTIDYVDRQVTLAGRPVQLTPTEYKLLVELSTAVGRVLTHEQLFQRIWGQDSSGNQNLLRSFVKSLRQKLEDNARNPTYILTEPGLGYRFTKA